MVLLEFFLDQIGSIFVWSDAWNIAFAIIQRDKTMEQVNLCFKSCFGGASLHAVRMRQHSFNSKMASLSFASHAFQPR
jgi:hypothetical protein